MKAKILSRLNKLWCKKEFVSHRNYIRKKRDFNPFISTNIISVLEQCSFQNKALFLKIEETKQHLKQYQVNHLTYMWPLKNSSSRIGNSALLTKINFLALSPDADCSCLQQIVLQEKNSIDKIINELSFYRNDTVNFRLPKFQQKLPATKHTFLTWFPPRNKCRNTKMESIDIVVQANILWFLGKNNSLETPGVKATINFIRKVIQENQVLTSPFQLSPYYPYPLAILYFISRAIHWGKIVIMKDMRRDIINLAQKIKPKTTLDRLYLAAIGKYWQDEKLTRINLDYIQNNGINTSDPIFIAPFVLPVVQDVPILWQIANKPYAHIRFTSEAYQLAILLWLLDA